MSIFYSKMPEDFKNAVEIIKRYCQNEACDYKCAQCPFTLAEIRCKDGKKYDISAQSIKGLN